MQFLISHNKTGKHSASRRLAKARNAETRSSANGIASASASGSEIDKTGESVETKLACMKASGTKDSGTQSGEERVSWQDGQKRDSGRKPRTQDGNGSARPHVGLPADPALPHLPAKTKVHGPSDSDFSKAVALPRGPRTSSADSIDAQSASLPSIPPQARRSRQSAQPQQQVHVTHTWSEYDPWALGGGEMAGGSVPLPKRHHFFTFHQIPQAVPASRPREIPQQPGRYSQPQPQQYGQQFWQYGHQPQQVHATHTWAEYDPWMPSGGEVAGGAVPLPRPKQVSRLSGLKNPHASSVPPFPTQSRSENTAGGSPATAALSLSMPRVEAWNDFQSSAKHKISHHMLWRDMRRSMGKSMGRFISIVCMVALGSFALVGLNVTGPDMRSTADQYFEQHQLADISVLSKTGFDDSQVQAISNASGVTKAEYGYFKDVAVSHRDESMRIFSNSGTISTYALRSGSMPKRSNEIAIDAQQAKKHPVGSTVSFLEKPGANGRTMLKGTRYKVTGIVDSVEIIGSVNRGLSDSGSGSLDGYGVVAPQAFASSSYNIARLRYKVLDDMPSHICNDYDKKVQQEKDLLSDSLDNSSGGVSQASSVAPAGQSSSDSPSMLPSYTIDSRRDIPGGAGYVTYDSISRIIDSLGGLFPIFMYLIAALLTFTSMTRFVDEERVGAGTLKAFGYSDWDVMKKFIAYGFVAGLIGGIAGAAAGQLLMPQMVYHAYSLGFDVPPAHLRLGVIATVVALLLAFAATVLPAYIAAHRELKEKTSALLSPKPPKGGASIALEKVGWLWNKFDFKNKITLRNIFRYKIRTFTTIIGVAGALALLVAGVGIQRSVDSINNLQYGTVIQYDLVAAQNDHASETQEAQISQELHGKSVKRFSPIHYESATMEAGPYQNKQDLTVIAAKDAKSFDGYVNLHERASGQHLGLDNYGAVISERLAKLNKVKAGDNIVIQDSLGRNRVVPISGVCEMYVGHFIFMNSKSYEKIFHQSYAPNADMIRLKDRSSSNAKREAARFMALDGITRVSQNSMLIEQTNMLVLSMSLLMEVLIAVSVLLSVVILYNLNNLNLAERVRELSTIKVLGYYNRETTMYVYRETLGLTVIGVLLGMGAGILLHERIIRQVAPENMMFSPDLTGGQFVFPVILIAVVTVILAFYVSARIAKIDMLKALQARE
ncbi:FtsX-like permease family protein [Bifidobacterium sp. ESL0784]|uniref:FtsX-like permease family protein n=1 Tax=Bifidobacterium sp. ESL0784 TaxID=2983231 RepID=UPI0023F83A51|nr:FtsX-like permease family protein [Bifidobacterium sp. ESL0784]MDF7640101.1 FtsX-like permease family protein [Bifidobacterium sp. ESL0784]